MNTNNKRIAASLVNAMQVRSFSTRRSAIKVASAALRQEKEYTYPKNYDEKRAPAEYSSPYFGPTDVKNLSGVCGGFCRTNF